MITTLIDTIHKSEPQYVTRRFEIVQKDTTRPRCQKTEVLELNLITIKPDGSESRRAFMEVDSWGLSPVLAPEFQLNVAYYSDTEKQAKLIDSMIRGIEDSFDECPPFGIELERINALKKILPLFK